MSGIHCLEECLGFLMKQVSYIECDISNANIYETRIRQVRVDNKSIVQNSDFAEYITNEEEENASV